MSKENTTVETVDIDINDILNVGSSVMLPTSDKSEKAKPNMFSRKDADLSFLDKPNDNQEDDDYSSPAGTAATEAAATSADPAKVVAAGAQKNEINNLDIDNIISEGDEEASKGTGRPKTDKDALVELTKKLIEKKMLFAFEDDKPIEKYSLQDFEELFEANEEQKTKRTTQVIAEQFFESLPPQFQYAYEYIQKGGRDLKTIFNGWAKAEETRQMDPSKETEARIIARSYLQATHHDWTPDEIEEEIVSYEDRGELEAKAAKFKPKLAALTEQQVAYQLQQQEILHQKQSEQAQMYMENIYKTLEPGELNGLKLDKKTQNMLFAGLVQPSYQSRNGQTNLLGHLLEKYQFVEPNHPLLLEALWLLADPNGYKDKVREIQKKEVTGETVRKLKFEQANKQASFTPDDEGTNSREKQYKIPRPSGNNFFKR